MIINDSEALKRLNSPMNLINQLRNNGNGNSKRKNAMSLFIRPNIEKIEPKPEDLTVTFNPFENSSSHPTNSTEPQPAIFEQSQTSLDSILKNGEAEIKLGLAHDRALELLNRSVDLLTAKLDDVKADKLPSVISAASKTVENIRRERSERDKNNKDREVHYHFYTPEQKKLTDYTVIDVA